ncbi:ribosomal RNA processing protein 1 homolog A-like isoform X2 [Hypomesus transpacificus]|uniref:ribosomal RNA processing protein 1 homolog A-like isoform X2 n=1 Tax=Hypomesus transpacificus TaxID=137520 RepID=UPI001F072A5C|nr:ribosomal RNA processing protein 1 homolog A-like isoform X2 [Hypomesus transpacificus]
MSYLNYGRAFFTVCGCRTNHFFRRSCQIKLQAFCTTFKVLTASFSIWRPSCRPSRGSGLALTDCAWTSFTSVLARFLELLTAQVLQSTSGAPCGLLFHIMDLYMTELAGVGSSELNAEQNLTFIKPFCKSAAKTKDRILLRAICNSIFSVIVDQAPFAIEDIMKEMKNARTEDSDSGQATEEENVNTKRTVKKPSRKSSGKPTNEENELFNLEDGLDIELPDDEGIGPVLQFDYGALADELFQLASRNNTPSFNRQKLYKVIKMLQDLSEGAFPQDEYPEEVSTDEDDNEMFGSRKRMKREIGIGEREEENGAS